MGQADDDYALHIDDEEDPDHCPKHGSYRGVCPYCEDAREIFKPVPHSAAGPTANRLLGARLQPPKGHTMSKSEILITPKARLSFPWLFEAQPPMQPGGKAMYSAVLLFAKDVDLKLLKAAASAAAAAMWPDKTKRPANFRSPFRNGDEKALDGYAGTIYISAKSQSRPGVVDQAVKPIMTPDVIYAGCYVIAQVTCYAYSKAGNNGVAFGLANIQKVADGEPFGNRSKPEDVFQAVAGAQKSAGGAARTAADDVDEWGAAAPAGAGEPDL